MEPLAAAQRVVDESFPHAVAAFLGGSVLTSHRTPTSDLDIVVVVDGPPYRETVRAYGWLVELFVHTRTSLRHYWDKDALALRAPLLRMCAEGQVLLSVDGVAEDVQSEAQQRFLAGPPPVSRQVLEWRRYALTDLLDDLAGAKDPAELTYLAGSILTAASELALIDARSWLGTGKALRRALVELNKPLADQLVVAYRGVVTTGETAALDKVSREILARAGGPLSAGYRVAGEPG
jgi:hypothetical protein